MTTHRVDDGSEGVLQDLVLAVESESEVESEEVDRSI
jgi:hypothetical protein